MASLPISWKSRSSEWQSDPGQQNRVTRDESLPPLEKPLTDRPVDLTKLADKVTNSPKRYVWVVRSTHPEDPPLPADFGNVAMMSTNHEVALRFLRVFEVTSPRHSFVPYLRWELPAEPGQLERLFSVLNLRSAYLEAFRRQRDPIARRLQPVFVEYWNGEPLGRRIHELCARPNRAMALFAQCFGDR